MNSLKIIEFNGQKVIDSRVVAERIEMQHKDLLKKVRNYEDILASAKLRPLDFFIKHEYQDTQGKPRLCYLLTKQGCEMVANKLTGEKGVLFTAEYVQAFNAMEEEMKQKLPTSPMELLELQYQALKEVNEKTIQNREEIKEVSEKTDKNSQEIERLGKNARLDPGQYTRIGQLVSSRINEIKQTRKLSLNKKQNGLLFQGLNHEIKQITGVGTRTDLRQKHYVKVCDFIHSWEPSSATMEKIKELEDKPDETLG